MNISPKEFNPGILNYEWRIISLCDKNCHYCIEREHIDRSVKTIFIDKDRFANQHNIFEFLRKEKGNVEFCGGETTLHPKAIEWFNQLCHENVNNSRNIQMVSHGDISLEKINEFDPGDKKEHLLMISYHFYQVDFNEWFKKLLLLKDKMNVRCSVVIPSLKQNWEQLKTNLETIKKHFQLLIKLELQNDKYNIEGYEYFKDLIDTDVFDLGNPDSYITDSDKVYRTNHQITVSLPIVKNKSLCKNVMIAIFDDVFSASCGQGKTFKVLHDTEHKDIKNKLSNNTRIMCTQDDCSQQYRFNNITIAKKFDDELFDDFREALNIKDSI